MPELPEVETVRRGMANAITGRTIKAVDIRREGLRTPFPKDMAERLSGRKVKKCLRRAKYILVEFDRGPAMSLHLGMSGRISLIAPKQAYEPAKHDHLIMMFDNGLRLVFNDPRRFGMVFLVESEVRDTHKAFANLGPEPLENDFTGPVLAAALKGRKTNIKAALLDQRVVAGLGNIYICEALYHARIDPRREAGTITGRQASDLVRAIKKVLNEALEAGGSTLRDYRQADGELGYFQHRFAVYGREGKPCPDCKCDVSTNCSIQRITQAGRSTFFCPCRQK
jgi:formamidopyrimidine-DNA glycosylase